MQKYTFNAVYLRFNHVSPSKPHVESPIGRSIASL